MRFERPKSLFGKHRYISEQFMLSRFFDRVSRGVAAIDLTLVPMTSPFPTEFIPERIRKSSAKRHLEKAKMILADVGV
jgi:hypothetical protein